MENRTTHVYKTSFSTLLQVAFIVLKLCGIIDWSWWWVMSPLWIGLSLVVLVFAVFGLVSYLSDKPKKPELNERGKSKWQERLEQVQEAQKKAQQNKSQI